MPGPASYKGMRRANFPALLYAVSVFHDENSSGKMDINFMRISREGVGINQRKGGHFGPPKFEAAAFRFSGGRADLKIIIIYL
jgi:uncharacterized protein (DUF2141 family)